MNDPKPSHPYPDLTRRSFLKNASTAMAGGALLGALPIERFALGAAPGDTIRIALVGAGGRGSGAADQALNAGGEGVKLTGKRHAGGFLETRDGGFAPAVSLRREVNKASPHHNPFSRPPSMLSDTPVM